MQDQNLNHQCKNKQPKTPMTKDRNWVCKKKTKTDYAKKKSKNTNARPRLGVKNKTKTRPPNLGLSQVFSHHMEDVFMAQAKQVYTFYLRLLYTFFFFQRMI